MFSALLQTEKMDDDTGNFLAFHSGTLHYDFIDAWIASSITTLSVGKSIPTDDHQLLLLLKNDELFVEK